MKHNPTRASAALLSLLVIACGEPEADPQTTHDTSSEPEDAGSDATSDTGDVSEREDAEPDTRADTDASIDTDTSVDDVVDAQADTLEPGDASDASDAIDVADVGDSTDATDVADTADVDATDATDVDADVVDVPEVPPAGPQLVSSSVTNGEIGASRALDVTLRFDRPLPFESLTGTIFAASERNTEPMPMEPHACPGDEADPSCVVMRFPETFVQPGTSELLGATYHSIIISDDLVDADGNRNDADIVIRFSTDGALLLLDETGSGLEATGLAYDPESRSLFYSLAVSTLVGVPLSGPGRIDRIRRPDGLFDAPSSLAELPTTFEGAWLTELDAIDGRLHVSMPYDRQVRVFDNLRHDGVEASEAFGPYTTLAPPDSSLLQVTSTAALDGGSRLFFGFGDYIATTRPTAVIALDAAGWSRFAPGAYSTVSEFIVAAREDAIPDVVFVSTANEVVALSADTGERLNTYSHVEPHVAVRVAIDSLGRLYFRESNRNLLHVFDPSGSDGFTLHASLDLEGRNSFAISERGNVVTVYSMNHREEPVIYRQRMLVCDGLAPCTSICDNRTLDGTETDVDCGGTCDPCPTDSVCGSDDDCASRFCDVGVCAVAPPNGCADGSREGFVDVELAPNIAGCSGAWSVPGVVDSVIPTCERQAGNDGVLRGGLGCAAVDLCAEGWHICASPDDVALNAPGGTCAAVSEAGDPARFFATAVRSGGSGACLAGPADVANDLFGCGNLGDPPPLAGTCGPLDRFSGDLCSALNLSAGLATWSCGEDGLREAAAVTHTDELGGGVLCCN